jgi:hypothetical protein
MSSIIAGGSFTLFAGANTLTITDSNITMGSTFIPTPAPGADPQAWGIMPFLQVTSQVAGAISFKFPPPDVNLDYKYFVLEAIPAGVTISVGYGAYDNFLPEVLPYVPECPELVAINAIRNAVIEFCKKSAWLLNEQTFDLVALQRDYQLTLPVETELVRVQDAWYDHVPLKPKGEDDLKRLYGLDWRVVTGRPAYYTQLSPDTIRLCPAPLLDEAAAIDTMVVLTPTRASTSCDLTIYERWLEGIACGAKARLMSLPQQSFTDPQMAMANKAMFNTAIGEARIERNRGMTRATLHVRPPRFV